MSEIGALSEPYADFKIWWLMWCVVKFGGFVKIAEASKLKCSYKYYVLIFDIVFENSCDVFFFHTKRFYTQNLIVNKMCQRLNFIYLI